MWHCFRLLGNVRFTGSSIYVLPIINIAHQCKLLISNKWCRMSLVSTIFYALKHQKINLTTLSHQSNQNGRKFRPINIYFKFEWKNSKFQPYWGGGVYGEEKRWWLGRVRERLEKKGLIGGNWVIRLD